MRLPKDTNCVYAACSDGEGEANRAWQKEPAAASMGLCPEGPPPGKGILSPPPSQHGLN